MTALAVMFIVVCRGMPTRQRAIIQVAVKVFKELNKPEFARTLEIFQALRDQYTDAETAGTYQHLLLSEINCWIASKNSRLAHAESAKNIVPRTCEKKKSLTLSPIEKIVMTQP